MKEEIMRKLRSLPKRTSYRFEAGDIVYWFDFHSGVQVQFNKHRIESCDGFAGIN
jgi:hypothetical protein